MHVEVIYALPHEQHSAHLELDEGATIGEALEAVQRLAPFADLDLAAAPVGIYGRPAGHETQLHHGDRVEIYRRLAVDPREARRQRASQTPSGR